MKLEIADIATNEKQLLKGFKVLGVFPFYLKYITTGTHIRLAKVKEQLRQLKTDEISIEDFENSKLQEKVMPLISKYCEIALINGRIIAGMLKPILRQKLKRCGHYHILNLYLTIQKLNQPAFFLLYWKLIIQPDNTLLKGEKLS